MLPTSNRQHDAIFWAATVTKTRNAKMNALIKSTVAAALLAASPAIADQTQWWRLAPSSRGVYEVCLVRGEDGLPAIPAKMFEFMKGQGSALYLNPGIEENTDWDANVHEVNVTWWKEGKKHMIPFYRTQEECQFVAKAYRWVADKDQAAQDKKLEKYR
jgi:hypothetical protein